MKRTLSGAIGFAVGTAAFAIMTGPAAMAWQSQTTTPGSTQAPRTETPGTQTPTTRTPGTQTPGSQASSSSGQQVTLSGCIEREADYRRSIGAGRGGAASTGVGAGNEFVLTNAMMSPAASSATAPTAGTSTPSATGTAGTTGGAYELTGTNEGDAATHVGKRVEITGMLKPAASASGGPTADLPGSQDLKLREVEVSSIREASGTCSTPSPR